MRYDFESIINRRGTGSSKWEYMLDSDPDVPPDIVPLSIGDMELPTAPEIVAGLKDCLDSLVLGYTNPTDDYFRAVLSWFERRHGWKAEREWMVPVDGVVPALFTAVHAFTRPGEAVAVMPPVYYPFFRAAGTDGRRVVEVPLLETPEGYRIDFEKMEAAARDESLKILFFCSPHNPVCRVWTEEELRRLGDICNRHGVIVVSDEIHMDFPMPGYRHRVFADLGPDFAANSIICTAPSKTFNLAGLQCSNLLIPNPALRERFKKEYEGSGRHGPNLLGLHGCRLAYERGEAWFDQVLALIKTNSDLVRSFMARHFPEIRMAAHESTFFVWLDFRPWKMDHLALEQFMIHKARLFLDEGYIFGTGGHGFERFNLACPTRVLEAALERLRLAGKGGEGRPEA